MSNWVRGYGERRAAARESGAGRHVLDEDAVLTPIFHALNRGGWRARQQPERAHRGDEVDEFRRDPLTAPIPVQAFEAAATPSAALPSAAPRRRRSAAVPDSRTAGSRASGHAAPRSGRSGSRMSESGAHALVEPREGGRHHFRLEAAGAHR